jgi:hypothetical protein
MDSRTKEHFDSQGKGLARQSSRPKTSSTPALIHPHMANRTDTSIGAPPRDNNPPDASSPSPLDPARQGKELPIPKVTWGMVGYHDPASAERVMSEATRSPDDYARNLHTALPSGVSEN